MVIDNHAECKDAVLELINALGRIKQLTEAGAITDESGRAIATLASDAVDRHSPILERF